MYFCVNEFEVGVNDSIFSILRSFIYFSIFSGNEQQKVYIEIYAELPLDYCGDVTLFQTTFVINLWSQWLGVVSDKIYSYKNKYK